MSQSYTGIVKWFNNAKGFGFIQHEPTGEDVFVHFSSIEGEDFKTLKEGEKVEYEIEKGEKGLHAVRVTRKWRPASTARAQTSPSLAGSVEVTDSINDENQEAEPVVMNRR